MKKSALIRIASLLSAALLSSAVITGCQSASAQNKDLMQNVTPNNVGAKELDNRFRTAYYDFSVKLLKETCAEEKNNTLISPVSILTAMSMTANGADGITKSEFEAALNGGITTDEMNEYMHSFLAGINDNKSCKLNTANSIWLNKSVSGSIRADFLQKNADYYSAGLYKSDFDESAKNEINKWTADNTDNMIKEILDEINPEALMYLINATVFDAVWQDEYNESQITDGKFTNSAGTATDVKMMHSEEQSYIKTENAEGFVKYYKDKEFAFAAILPDEDIKLYDYIEKLDYNALKSSLENKTYEKVLASMPKFSFECGTNLNLPLQSIGLKSAFDENSADFSKMMNDNPDKKIDGVTRINNVIHKTYIKVDEKGTKAGAATSVEMVNEAATVEEAHIITLDRPFLFMIIDCESNLPLFIGAATDI